MGDSLSALSQYQEIIDHHKDGIYIDEAYYFSAEIYNKQSLDVNQSSGAEQAKQKAAFPLVLLFGYPTLPPPLCFC